MKNSWNYFLGGIIALLSSSLLYAELCHPTIEEANPPGGAIVLGDGTTGSVDTTDLQNALDLGGFITFNVGPGPETIVLSAALQVTGAVVVDGGGVVTLSGGNAHRIFELRNPLNISYTLGLQNVNLVDGDASGEVPPRGGAIYRVSEGPWQALSLEVINASFVGNVAASVGQDDGGGAIYATGMQDVILVNTAFHQNSGSNGGALYSLGTDYVEVVDSEFTENAATGNGGNPGNGGNGGAVGVDGAERTALFCGVKFIDNSSNAYGGAFFSVMYDDASLSSFNHCIFDSNQNPTLNQFAGAAYIQGGPFSIRHSLFKDNQAEATGALFLGPGASGELLNSTFNGNVARGSLGGAMSISQDVAVTITHCTIEGNSAPDPLSFAGGINVANPNQVTMANTILANNTGGNVWNPWNILNTVGDGGGNIQFPQTRPNGQSEVPATATVLWANPLLLPLADNGGFSETMAFGDGSPAHQGGVGGLTTTDQRRYGRVGEHDVGAWERSELLFADGFESGDLGGWSTVQP